MSQSTLAGLEGSAHDAADADASSDDCECDGLHGATPCWTCFRDGLEEQ